jgi:hypothetical protein
MAESEIMVRHVEGVGDDGTPRFRYELTQEGHDAGYVAFLTGPISGTIAVGDTAYDVTENAIAVKKEHVGPLHLAIHKAHHAAGRFLDAPLPELAEVSLS